MGNKKKLIQKGLIELFPKNIDCFIDVFAGSSVVSMNVKANQYYINDNDKNLKQLYELFKSYESDSIINHINSRIDEYGLARERTSHKVFQDNRKEKYITVYAVNFLAFIFFNLFLIDIYAQPCYYIIVPREQRRKTKCELPRGRQERRNVIMTTEKFCTKCGSKFIAIGREVICPKCKAAAAEESKKAAVLKAKKASWAGESVPVRISGRASTLIREYGKAHDVPFAESLDELLKASSFFQIMDKAWDDITPYKSQRRDKRTTETQDAQAAQEVKTAQDAPHEAPQEVKQAQDVASKVAAKKPVKAAKKTATASVKK